MRSFLLVALFLLSACDAWPIIIDNRGEETIRLQYLHREHVRWSSEFPIKADVAMSLARAHWMQDITGIKIVDGHKRYEWSDQSLRRLEKRARAAEWDEIWVFLAAAISFIAGKGS